MATAHPAGQPNHLARPVADSGNAVQGLVNTGAVVGTKLAHLRRMQCRCNRTEVAQWCVMRKVPLAERQQHQLLWRGVHACLRLAANRHVDTHQHQHSHQR